MLRCYRPREFSEQVLEHLVVPEMDPKMGQVVMDILRDVREQGDSALLRYTRQFDGVDLSPEAIKVPDEAIGGAERALDPSLREILEQAIDNLRRFHREEVPRSWHRLEEDGRIMGQTVRPLRRVGLYVPGGRAVYPSSLLMNVIPAQMAGVSEIAVCTPPDAQGQVHPLVLAATALLDVADVYRVGGAQAIGAMAYGTETILPVDKIAGPGNAFVAAAKRLVFGQVDIDSIAGPSELTVICDETSDPKWVAADLLAQAEHDPESRVFLLCTSSDHTQAILADIERQLTFLDRTEIIEEAFTHWGAAVIGDVEELIALSNQLAPEHLSLQVKDPWSLLLKIKNAGAIFLGKSAAVSFGDYTAGPNHVLPTATTARFASPLSVEDFVKRTNFLYMSEDSAKRWASPTARLADLEGLTAHARAARLRGQQGEIQND